MTILAPIIIVMLLLLFMLFVMLGRPFPFHIYPAVSFHIVWPTGIYHYMHTRRGGHITIDIDTDIGRARQPRQMRRRRRSRKSG